ncbi:MAG: glutamate--cysteine ligase [Rhodospirillaceae bacterium]|nr:MAG: glutamate--cysteine ligase [Rhodospirillaceae bacterium]
MSAPPTGVSQPVHSRKDLVEALERGCKPASHWRIGTEHEKFLYDKRDFSALPYSHETNAAEGAAAGSGDIRRLLNGLVTEHGWTPLYEGENVVALTRAGANITLEPGGQFELSGAAVANLHETEAETRQHIEELQALCVPMGVGTLSLGYQPELSRDEIPWMPKARYRIMRAQMKRKGMLGLDMMKSTATIQVNLDFESEADMVRKLRVSLALQPVATAIFANSPFSRGRLNGYRSFRSAIWQDTDPDRTGGLEFAFEDGMGFERYVDYALDVPMYFIHRGGEYFDASGLSFRDFMAQKLALRPGEMPLKSDWDDHLTTLFPEVRIKSFLEMRGGDAGPVDHILGLSALWTGLLYDSNSLQAAWDLVAGWGTEDRRQLALDVPTQGLKATVAGRSVLDLARDVVAISKAGLRRRAVPGPDEQADEAGLLAPLEALLDAGHSPADRLIEAFEGAWQGDIRQVYQAASLF